MGLFSKKPSIEELDRQDKKAKINLDCSRSVGVIIDLQRNLEAIQSFMTMDEGHSAIYAARLCCANPIILCALNDCSLPYAGLTTIQGSILSAICNLNANFYSDPLHCLIDIAKENRLSSVIHTCENAQNTLNNARLNINQSL